MADDILKNIPLPADLPENWTSGQTIAPTGAEVGMDEQHGYNYLMMQVNNAQRALKALAAQREEDLARIKFWASDDPTSPASFIGGTWERIEGKFIIGASDTYPAGSTGGSTAHEHEYKLGFMWRFGALVGYPSSAITTYNYKTQSWNDNNKKINDGQYTLANDGFSSTYGENPGGEAYSVTGNTASSSSIPPYYSVYIWRRVA